MTQYPNEPEVKRYSIDHEDDGSTYENPVVQWSNRQCFADEEVSGIV